MNWLWTHVIWGGRFVRLVSIDSNSMEWPEHTHNEKQTYWMCIDSGFILVWCKQILAFLQVVFGHFGADVWIALYHTTSQRWHVIYHFQQPSSLTTFQTNYNIMEVQLALIPNLINWSQRIFAHFVVECAKTGSYIISRDEIIATRIYMKLNCEATSATKRGGLPGHTQYSGTAGADRSAASVDWIILFLLLLLLLILDCFQIYTSKSF